MSFFFAWCGQSVLYPGSSQEDFSFGSYFMFNRVFAAGELLSALRRPYLGMLMPWTNDIVESIFCTVHNMVAGTRNGGCKKGWEVLGLVLASKLDLLAPFINDNGAVVFPDDVEDDTAALIRKLRRRAMQLSSLHAAPRLESSCHHHHHTRYTIS